MITLSQLKFSDLLPDSLAYFRPLAQAFDAQLQALARNAPLTLHLPRLDDLPSSILNLLAESFHVDFFNSALDDDTKRQLIRQSIAFHRAKGTLAPVEFVANLFFHDASIKELGNFYFKLQTKQYTASPEIFPTFVRMLNDAKNVRSWLKDIDLDLSPPATKIFTAGTIIPNGIINFDLPRPKDSRTKIHVGNLHLLDGSTQINLRPPMPSRLKIRVGAPFVLTGHALFGSKDNPIFNRIRAQSVVELATADSMLARADNLAPTPQLVDLIRIFFRPYRFLQINNPRQNVSPQEIKSLADFVLQNNLLVKNGELITQAPRATLTSKYITHLL